MYGQMKLLAGRSCPEIAQEVSSYLSSCMENEVPLIPREIFKFNNDNIYVKIGESIRGQDVYVMQSMSRPVNDSIMELLIMLDAVRRDSAGRITAVIPYMAYTRSDKKDEPRTAITARLIADMIEIAGADRYITLDLHAPQIQGFFKIPGDVIDTLHLIGDYVKERVPMENTVVCSVDLGFAKQTRNWGKMLGVSPVFVEKERNRDVVKATSLIGDVKNKNVLLVDDECDTGKSIEQAVQVLRLNGAQDIYLAFKHPVFSEGAIDLLASLGLKKIFFYNTIPVDRSLLSDNMEVISVANLLGEVMRRSHLGVSVGKMGEEGYTPV